MRAILALLFLAVPAATMTADATSVGCEPNGYGYDCHLYAGPVCHEWEFHVGQPSRWHNCTGRELADTIRDLLP